MVIRSLPSSPLPISLTTDARRPAVSRRPSQQLPRLPPLCCVFFDGGGDGDGDGDGDLYGVFDGDGDGDGDGFDGDGDGVLDGDGDVQGVLMGMLLRSTVKVEVGRSR